ncbi:MAG: ATP-binding protein [Terracidiphilus sp.]
MSENKYQMKLSLNVLNHLGINLYSNVPAVLSEVVANAWDADAEEVNIQIEADKITITDNGHGMTAFDINEKFLTVGYRRRDRSDGKITPKLQRAVMGRKGIGKLSLFSIANHIEVFSVKDGDENAFAMDVPEIQKKIESEEGSYNPTELETFPNDLTKGTRIVLTGLKKNVLQSRPALRKRLARRFSVLGSKYKFSIKIDGSPVTIENRDYFDKIQFLWTFGTDGDEITPLCRNAEKIEKRDGTVSEGEYTISGWIGTVRESGALKDEYDNLNKILLMVRGKLAQEDVLESFNEGGMYTKYLIGEIHADFLDQDDKEDIATSSRQRIVEDDARYTLLTRFLSKELKNIQNRWTDLRNDEGEKKALEIVAVKNWFDSLSVESRKRAKSLFGKINQLTLESDEQRKRLFKHSILAFESLRYRENLEMLDRISADNLPAFTEAFANLDDLEATLYYQLVSERVQVIDLLNKKVQDNELEKIIQEHVFTHLWLLDPSWERATTTEYMEKQVQKEFDNIEAGLSAEEKAGRLDIKYRTSSGRHIIVELKRFGRKLDTAELMVQVAKYNAALKKLLAATNRSNEPIDIICVIGQPLRDWSEPKGREESDAILKAKNARVMMYQQLINNAYKSYSEFLEKRKDAGRVLAIIQSIDESEVI